MQNNSVVVGPMAVRGCRYILRSCTPIRRPWRVAAAWKDVAGGSGLYDKRQDARGRPQIGAGWLGWRADACVPPDGTQTARAPLRGQQDRRAPDLQLFCDFIEQVLMKSPHSKQL